MANHIFMLYMIISFCTGIVFYIPCLVVYLQKGDKFKYYNKYKFFFHSFTALTALIFSNSIYYYINHNIPEAGNNIFISLIAVELVSIHMFLLFMPLFIHNFFSVRFSKILNTAFIILSIASLIFSLSVFFGYYATGDNVSVKNSLPLFPVASVYNGIFALVILYASIICISHLKKLNDDLLQRMVISYLILILIVFFGILIGLLFKPGINMKIYLMPGFYIIWNIIASYYCVKYYLFENAPDSQKITLEQFAKEYELTDRETEVVKLLIRGCGNTEISDELSISVPTVKSHMSNIFKKAGCSSRAELLSIVFHGI